MVTKQQQLLHNKSWTDTSPETPGDISRYNMILNRLLQPKHDFNLHVLSKHTVGFRLVK